MLLTIVHLDCHHKTKELKYGLSSARYCKPYRVAERLRLVLRCLHWLGLVWWKLPRCNEDEAAIP